MLWEGLALSLAEKAGIEVPAWRIENIAGKAVIIIRRFDRMQKKRYPFLSAMSMIDALDNEQHSYLELVDALRQHGAFPKQDIHNLWRRIVFNVLISNTDDHLRNHGFLYVHQQGWKLSPLYDVNPTSIEISPRILRTAIDLNDSTASLDLALSVAGEFDMKLDQAKAISKEVGEAVSKWRNVARDLGISSTEMGRMASAFEHVDLEQAIGF